MGTYVIARLLGLLQDPRSDVRQASIDVIAALTKFGRLIYHFVLRELMIRQMISAPR